MLNHFAIAGQMQQVVESAAISYGFASGAAKTWRQAGGNCASVIGGRGFGGAFGGFGWIMESLNQKAKSPALQPSLSEGAGWPSHSPLPGGHLMRMWK